MKSKLIISLVSAAFLVVGSQSLAHHHYQKSKQPESKKYACAGCYLTPSSTAQMGHSTKKTQSEIKTKS